MSRSATRTASPYCAASAGFFQPKSLLATTAAAVQLNPEARPPNVGTLQVHANSVPQLTPCGMMSELATMEATSVTRTPAKQSEQPSARLSVTPPTRCPAPNQRLPGISRDRPNMRPSQRRPDQLRPLRLTRGFTNHAEGSVLIECGATRVLCTASIEERVPGFRRGSGGGWITAEYGMLPRATSERTAREAVHGRQGGRTVEIQRLIGRALRAAADLNTLGERTITLDCDVLQADGGTRTAAISGAWVALQDAAAVLAARGQLRGPLLTRQVAAVSVGVYRDTPVLDLDYAEDAAAATDMNVVMDAAGGLIEVQGTAEGQPFSRAQLARLLDLAATGIDAIMEAQRAALAGLPHP